MEHGPVMPDVERTEGLGFGDIGCNPIDQAARSPSRDLAVFSAVSETSRTAIFSKGRSSSLSTSTEAPPPTSMTRPSWIGATERIRSSDRPGRWLIPAHAGLALSRIDVFPVFFAVNRHNRNARLLDALLSGDAAE